ncbi:MAG: DUF89 family protein [Bacteriovoracaceae bacterium]|nr:DUF89 family protein [Bacteriovoracaceae bacterium]
MKSYIECYSCFVRQSVDAGKIATSDENIRWEIMKEVMKKSLEFSRDDSPAIMGKVIHQIVRDISGNNDPYKNVKDEYNKKASKMIGFLTKIIDESGEKLHTALKIAAIGNIIDFGPYGMYGPSLEEFVCKKLKSEFAGNVGFGDFKNKLDNAKSVLYVADNCGEIVFDSIFINRFLKDKTVYLATRGGAVLNDVTMDDIKEIQFSDNVKLIDTGDNAPGAILKFCSDEFNKLYNDVDLVILKGQGNYEGIGKPNRKNVYSVLIVKCPVIASHIGCAKNELVLTVPD